MDRTLAWIIFISALVSFVTFEARTILHVRGGRSSVVAARAAAAAQTSGAPVSSPQTSGARGSCLASDLRLAWPIAGTAEKDWVIANYVDLDPVTGHIADYTGAAGDTAVTYDGHTGIDIEVPSFRAVDIGTPVVASADGVVEATYDESYDRNMSCSTDQWNFVKVRHANGFATTYAHLRKKSVVVARGTRVTTGQRLGLLGSSGCSVYPHVHLEVTNCLDQPVEMVKERMFISMPTYSRSAATTLMETSLFQPAITDIKSVQDPGTTDLNEVAIGFPFSVAATISHLHKGDILLFEFITPSNARADFDHTITVDRDYIRSSWWAEFTLGQPGSWLVQFKVNGRLIGERTILVHGTANGE